MLLKCKQATDAGPTNEEIIAEANRRLSGNPGYTLERFHHMVIELTRNTSWHKPAPEVDKLLPCPFCESIWVTMNHPANGSAKSIMCNACNAHGPLAASFTDAQIISAWNTRAEALAKRDAVPEDVVSGALWLKAQGMGELMDRLADYILGEKE